MLTAVGRSWCSLSWHTDSDSGYTSSTRCALELSLPGLTSTVGCDTQKHGWGDSSTSHKDRMRLHPGGAGFPKMMAQAPCPCSEDPSATRASPCLLRHKLTPSYSYSGQCHVRLAVGSEAILELHAEITAQRGGLGAAHGRGHAVPPRLSRLCPCSPVPRPLVPGRRGRGAIPAVSASLCRQSDTRRSRGRSRSSAVCGLSVPRQHSPLPARLAAAFFTQLWVKCGILLPQFPAAPYVALFLLPQHLLKRRVWHFPCSAVKHRAASRHPQTWLPLVPCGPSVQCHGHSAKRPLTLTALCCVDVPPCSSSHTPCWSTQCL